MSYHCGCLKSYFWVGAGRVFLWWRGSSIFPFSSVCLFLYTWQKQRCDKPLKIIKKPKATEMHSPFGHVMYYVHTWRDRHEKCIVTICDHDQHTTTNTQADFGSVLSKDRTKFEGSKMCHNWFWIDYFRLNWYLIIEILVHICWSKFIIARPLCWEIIRNNAVNYFKFCPVFDKDCLHFQKGDASAPPLWHVPICTYQISEPVVLSIF